MAKSLYTDSLLMPAALKLNIEQAHIMLFVCPHKFGQTVWMTTARLCVFFTVADYSWNGISLTPTGHCMKRLRKHIIKIQSQKPICITSYRSFHTSQNVPESLSPK